MKLSRLIAVLLSVAVSISAVQSVAQSVQQPSVGKKNAKKKSSDNTEQKADGNQTAGTAETAKKDDSNAENEKDDPALKGLTWRLVGPYRGGRSLAVTGVVGDPLTFYFGGVAGGVWKTTDGGMHWTTLTDKYRISSVGSIAVAESDPNIIYVGTGEACYRGNIVAGDGVYKSTDAGKTWRFIGLRDSEHIGHVIVHPRNPDVVFVAAMGHAYGANAERGVFRSTDGGKNWEKVLYKDDKTGAVDITFDPGNPSILFAALYESRRMPWGAISGGPGGGLYRSADGGTTWKRLEGNGLPSGVLGKIGVTVSGANSNRVWAQIEAEKGGLYRSDDGGQNWQLINDSRNFRQRAWYYSHIFADPKNPDGLYSLNVGFWHSTDGGKTFKSIQVPHGDNHGLWIDPTNPKRMIESNDGGATVTTNGGETWTGEDNQPTAQFYHVITDNRFPYYMFGAQQDNSTVAIASRTSHNGIDRTDWYTVGGCESGYIAPDPRNPDIVFAGCYGGHISRTDKKTEQSQEVNAWPLNPIGAGASELKYRYQWTAPIVISPNDPAVLYHGSQYLMKSTDNGISWTEISPDLTRNDRTKQQSSGGPITQDNTSVEYYDTIFTIAESPLKKDLVWVGTDDGLIHITQDGGKSWSNITPKGMPEWSRVSLIETSPFDAGTAYAAVERHELDDYAPYIYKTSDFGKSWSRIESDLPARAFVRAVREDKVRKNLLFAATEIGVFYSLDGGAHWRSLQRNLPLTSIRDIVVKNDDLVVATHGRSFWVLDDISPLRQTSADVATADAYLFKPTVAYRMGGGPGGREHTGQNPPSGAIIYYQLKNALKKEDTNTEDKSAKSDAQAVKPNTKTSEGAPEGKAADSNIAEKFAPTAEAGKSEKADESRIKLEILDSSGRTIRAYPPKEASGDDGDDGPAQPPAKLPAEAGLNRFVWDLHYENVSRVAGATLWGGGVTGSTALPGTYQVKLTVDGKSYTAPFEVKSDPRVKVNPQDLQKQFDLMTKIQTKVGDAHAAVNQIRDVRRQIEDLQKRLTQAKDPHEKAVADAAKKLQDKMKPIEEALIQVKSKSGQDVLNYGMKLNNQMAALGGDVDTADAAPTKQAYEVYNMLAEKLDAQLSAWHGLMTTDVVAFNQFVREQQVPAVVVGTAPQK